MALVGAFLSILTAFSWAASSIIHPHISRTLGVHACMVIRQPLAGLCLVILCALTQQFDVVSGTTLLIAAFSGIVGAALVDYCVFESVLLVGVRTALVCASLSSCFTALLSFFFLDEYINGQGILGIIMATVGVMIVIFSEHSQAATAQATATQTSAAKPSGAQSTVAQTSTIQVPTTLLSGAENRPKPTLKQEIIGITLALVGAFALALGFITSKMALNEGMSPLYLGLWRTMSGCLVIWIVAAFARNLKSSWVNLKKHPELIKFFFLGCLFGPVGGTWLSSVALLYAPAAIVATLIGLQPIACTIISGIMERRMPSLGSIVGACITCSGAALLLLRNVSW